MNTEISYFDSLLVQLCIFGDVVQVGLFSCDIREQVLEKTKVDLCVFLRSHWQNIVLNQEYSSFSPSDSSAWSPLV